MASTPDGLVTLEFAHDARAVEQARAFARHHPVQAVVGVDDDTAYAAAAISHALGLPANPLPAVGTGRNKHRQREVLSAAGIPVPAFQLRHVADDPAAAAREAPYPCVLKPLHLSASRGVIRADDPDGFLAARERLAGILAAPDVGRDGADRFLVEAYVPGREFALEGLVVDGVLSVLALFDKPDPLEGPFFEETIYVTPSRAAPAEQAALRVCAAHAVQALGLVRGPIHAELRWNERGPWLIELAARPIGGKCGQVLRFGPEGERSLEEVLLAAAVGTLDAVPRREEGTVGVLMIPVPRGGTVREVVGTERARRVPNITDVVITVHRGQAVQPLPEASTYVGFLFARAGDHAAVESALREAYRWVEPVID